MKPLLVGPVLLFGISVFVTAGPGLGQGPAGAGASAVAQDSSRSLNPMNWLRKDSKNSIEAPGNRSDSEKKLTPRLQAQGLLGPNAAASDACAPFTSLDSCLATLHASHNLGVNFLCLRAVVTGVQTSGDVSSCEVADEGKPQSLSRALRQLKPDANAKQAAKEAEQQANEDLRGIGGS